MQMSDFKKLIFSPVLVAAVLATTVANVERSQAETVDALKTNTVLTASDSSLNPDLTPSGQIQEMTVAQLTNLASKTETQSEAKIAAPIKPLTPVEESSLIRNLNRNDLGETTAQNVTSVSQLSDVQPTDWAFTALQSLVERYGCIAGYPDRTYRGQRATSRYEFAAGLNACLDKINELIASGLADKVSKEDLAALQKLQEEFAAELAALRTRIDAVEAKTAQLEAQQFSTTTKLNAEAIVALGDSFGGNNINGFLNLPTSDQSNTVFQYRVRLNFDTSFSGRDRLRVRLQASNAKPVFTIGDGITSSTTFSNDGRSTFDETVLALNNNSVSLDRLDYRFPIGDKARVTIFAKGAAHYYYADTINPYFDDQTGGNGAISNFGERNPIYNINAGGAGIGFNYIFSDALRLDLGYIAVNANDPTGTNGLFGDTYSALAQLVIKPSDNFKIGLSYAHAYSAPNIFRYGTPGNNTGSIYASLIGLGLPGLTGLPDSPAFFGLSSITDTYGVSASYQFNPGFAVSAWGGYTAAKLKGFGDGDIWNYAISFAFPNLFQEGNLGGIIFGSEPTLTGLRYNFGGTSSSEIRNRDNVLHLEAFYKYRLSKNISITPGIVWLPAVNQRSANDDIFVVTLRTTFTF
jgi:hypothetical protein